MADGPNFDLVKAAESLLEHAKRLASTGSERTNGAGASGAEELKIRRVIAQTAKKIAFETAPAIDVVKSDWVVLADVAAWNIFLEWSAFDHIPLDSPISYADLAKAVDAQESLVARIAGLLVATGKLKQPSPYHVAHSRVSLLYRSDSSVSNLAAVAFGNGMKPYAHWPEYFLKHGRREPSGNTNTPFSFGWGHLELAPWEIKALYPDYGAKFTKSMKSRQIVGGDMKLTGPDALYDLGWLGEEAQARKDGAAVVDVGGGLGQLLKDVIREVPGIRPRQCVLQDREEVINEAKEVGDEALKDVEMIAHDFHTPQPVKGALVYLLRRILLDYSDELAAGILRQLAEALPEDELNARVIIMEERLLDTPTPQNRIVDMVMLNLGGKLRNEKMFAELARAAGLRMVRFYAREGDATCVVECAKA
ncbi:Demethylsterigmatocystin 6-O-methyltransferase [Diplogelasinospora grovesii]|uniref:Demethylsterigmatocystin 6-O-methyltransferase n=1 Tax=Diplogelasinospora grovesii TaxID=303347 RepID=A0AAN6N2V1_9PEZI|nr:Demethylsterigmatocystin 6-O-methyltransferase [Diplogelasinospora grovesii]